MKKAELEDHRTRYHELMNEARSEVRRSRYREAVGIALSACEFIDGMMQFARRYEDKELNSIDAIELIARYAPLLFEHASLDSLETLLKDTRRIEKNTSVSLGHKVADAKSRMWDAHRLWNLVEQSPDTRQDQLATTLEGNQNEWRALAETWEKMGVLHRKADGGSYRLSLVTRMGQLVPAKCPSCGEVTEAPKGMLLDELSCPRCGSHVMFVLLADQQVDASEG